MAMAARLVAQLADIDLKDGDPCCRKRREAGLGQRLNECLARRVVVQDPQLRRRVCQWMRQAGEAHMLTLAAALRICRPCTSDAPPRIADATCTASLICSRFEPFSRQACV